MTATEGAGEHSELAEVLQAVLGEVGERPRPETALKAACLRLRAGVQDGEPAYLALATAAGLDAGSLPDDDERLWLTLAMSTVSPPGSDAEALGVTAWLTVMAAMTLWGSGTQASPAALATYVVESEGGDRDALEQAFGPVVERWLTLGALDATERLTPLGWWGLPEAQLIAWSG